GSSRPRPARAGRSRTRDRDGAREGAPPREAGAAARTGAGTAALASEVSNSARRGFSPPEMARVVRLGVLLAGALLVVAVPAATPKAGGPIGFETPSIVDPIHTFGEPTIGVDPQGRVFVSGPTGTGTQRSAWVGSVDGGHSFRVITPHAPPTAIQSIEDPPGGGDTDLNFDRAGHQYFADLYALACLRVARTDDGGATVNDGILDRKSVV